jgi:hypothetical protein
MTSKVSDGELAAFTQMAQEKTGLRLGYEIGKKYARLFDTYDNIGGVDQRCVFGFIDLTNGNILRADGWNRPKLTIKNPVQGNVFDEDKGSGSIRGSRIYRK